MWRDEDGGRLELYDAVMAPTGNADRTDEVDDDVVVARRVPAAVPSKTILPEFNTMAYFAVEPGVSFGTGGIRFG